MSWVLFAVGTPYAAEALEIIRRGGSRMTVAVANRGSVGIPDEIAEVVLPSQLRPMWLHLPVTVPLTTPGHRKLAVEEARSLGFRRFPPLVDPSALVASTAALGEGCLLNGAVVVAAGTRLAAFVSLNRGASVGHHCVLHPWVSLGPGARLCGHVQVGEGAYVGAGACVLPQRRIGRNAVVGAGAVVTKDVAEGAMVVGNPARVIREQLCGFNDVGV